MQSSQVNTFKIVRYVIRIIHDEMTDVICHKCGPKLKHQTTNTILFLGFLFPRQFVIKVSDVLFASLEPNLTTHTTWGGAGWTGGGQADRWTLFTRIPRDGRPDTNMIRIMERDTGHHETIIIRSNQVS